MARIIVNPRVPNRIRIVDYLKYAKASPARSEELMEWYENGDLIVLSNYRFEAGRDLFHRVTFPNRKGSNKLLLHLDAARHGEAPREQHWESARESAKKCGVAVEEFEDAVRKANDELLEVSEKLFPNYRYLRRYCIYNLTEMLAHNMHFDSPQHAGDYTQLRAFVNVDIFPRIWRIGDSLEAMARNCYRSANLKNTIGQHVRTFTRQTTLASFGDRYESGSHPYPMHSIAFQPGEVWFLNPNMLAHEVVYGRRILDGVFLFESSGLQNPKRFYPEIVEQLHQEQLGKPGHWWHKQKARLTGRVRSMMGWPAPPL
jgi:hypothetical protein